MKKHFKFIHFTCILLVICLFLTSCTTSPTQKIELLSQTREFSIDKDESNIEKEDINMQLKLSDSVIVVSLTKRSLVPAYIKKESKVTTTGRYDQSPVTFLLGFALPPVWWKEDCGIFCYKALIGRESITSTVKKERIKDGTEWVDTSNDKQTIYIHSDNFVCNKKEGFYESCEIKYSYGSAYFNLTEAFAESNILTIDKPITFDFDVLDHDLNHYHKKITVNPEQIDFAAVKQLIQKKEEERKEAAQKREKERQEAAAKEKERARLEAMPAFKLGKRIDEYTDKCLKSCDTDESSQCKHLYDFAHTLEYENRVGQECMNTRKRCKERCLEYYNKSEPILDNYYNILNELEHL